MGYSMWLNQAWLSQTLANRVFHIELIGVSEDAVSLRLRSEIARWLHLPLVTSAPQSTQPTVTLVCDVRSCLDEEGFHIDVAQGGNVRIESSSTKGLLYGFYAWLRDVGLKAEHSHTEIPDQKLRMINQWDQADGSVERGYAGESIFYGRWGSNVHAEFFDFPERSAADVFRGDISRIRDYARFLASVGINAISLNNVNVCSYATRFIVEPYLQRIAEITRIFSSFGIKSFLAVNFAAPKVIGNLTTSDPCDKKVIAWWEKVVDHIYEVIPDFGGFVVKADSEGEPGPYQYGRDHADGANLFARVLAPHHGIVIWRAFVYNSHTDWRDRSVDRARAAFDNFAALDGKFDVNAVLQVKFGPIDFQTREPLSPLLARMQKTNLIMEFEITAEYLGHQIDVNYVLPQWIGMASWQSPEGSIRERLPRVARQPQFTGFAAISNVGMDENWTGNTLAQANLYGYARFCWSKSLTSQEIAHEWVDLSFENSTTATKQVIESILNRSNKAYEDYCAPLGVGFMVNRNGHYGPGPDDYEFDRWGTYHYADRDGVGVDRTSATGTGFAGQYPSLYSYLEKPETTPDELLLFFHHVNYTYRLHCGETVIQHIYNTHFAGVEEVEKFVDEWNSIQGDIEPLDWENVAERLRRQKANAINWRDQINTFFWRLSGIADEQGRSLYS